MPVSDLEILNSTSLDALGCSCEGRCIKSSSAGDIIISTIRQGCIVEVDKFFAVKSNKTLQDAITNSAGSDSSDNLVFQIEGIPSNIGYLPVAAFNHL
jgi:hypothetical protein